MNKKSLLFSVILIFIALAALSMMIHIIGTLEDELGKTRYVSQRSFEVLKAETFADTFNVYITQSARFAVENAIYKLSKNSGFRKISDACGGTTKYRNKEYALWNTLDKPKEICIPDYHQNFLHFFNKDLNLRLMDYAALEKKVVPIDNYEYFLKNKILYGITIKPMLKSIMHPKLEQTEGTYAFKPSFKIDTKYKLDFYKTLEEIAARITTACANKFITTEEKSSCSNNEITSYQGIVLRFFEDSEKGTILIIDAPQETRTPIAFAVYIPSK